MKRSVQGFLNRQYLCVLRRCAWHHALSCFITTTSLLCGSAHAGNIATDGRTQTQLNVRGAVTDITTQTARGASASEPRQPCASRQACQGDPSEGQP